MSSDKDPSDPQCSLSASIYNTLDGTSRDAVGVRVYTEATTEGAIRVRVQTDKSVVLGEYDKIRVTATYPYSTSRSNAVAAGKDKKQPSSIREQVARTRRTLLKNIPSNRRKMRWS